MPTSQTQDCELVLIIDSTQLDRTYPSRWKLTQ